MYCSTVKTTKPTPTHHTIEDEFIDIFVYILLYYEYSDFKTYELHVQYKWILFPLPKHIEFK